MTRQIVILHCDFLTSRVRTSSLQVPLTGVHKPMAKAAVEYAAFLEYIERIGARESAIAIKPPACKK